MRLSLEMISSWMLFLIMFLLMLSLNKMAFDTKAAWAFYDETLDALEDSAGADRVVKEQVEEASHLGYEMKIQREEEQIFVKLDYRVTLPLLGLKSKQRVCAYLSI